MSFYRFIFFKLLLLFNFISFSLAGSGERIVAYVTDLEGSRQRFEKFLESSEAFELGGDGRFHLKENAQFVFGGDAFDRYLGSRWVVSELVRLKEETPDRVVLILGNRDINKMRLTSELSPEALSAPPVKFHFTREDEWRKHIGPETRAERLKFIFAYTMGAPHAFNLFRREIAHEGGRDEESVTDEEVVEHVLSELGPGGLYRRFLELGQLAYRLENTLFIHGGITEKNFGFIPGDSRRRVELDEWVTDLNRWLQVGVETWKKREGGWSGVERRPEQDWLDYPMPEPGMNSKPESVVTGRNSDRHNNPIFPEQSVVNELLRQGIERVVIGHTPTGDYPIVLRTEQDDFEVISADNSYARDEAFASIVHFIGPGLRRTELRGVMVIEDQVEDVFSDLVLGVRTPLGKRVDGELFLGRLRSAPGRLVSFRYAEQFRVVTQVVPESEVWGEDASLAAENCSSPLESTR